jgi:hypothetical protein
VAYSNARHREKAEVGEIDNLTREKIQEWQVRRLEVKDQMQLHPEKTLELSRVLDLMDDEHAAILCGSTGNQIEGVNKRGAIFARIATPEHLAHPAARNFELQLHVTAQSPADLRRLLEMAVHELQGCIDAKGTELAGEHRNYPGGMSGTLGSYEFELSINGEDSNE